MTIGSNTIIGAGSVVNKDIPNGVIAVGNPCKVIRKITEADKKKYPIFEESKMSSEKMDQSHCCLYTDNGIGIWIYMVESVHRTVSKECI